MVMEWQTFGPHKIQTTIEVNFDVIQNDLYIHIIR